MKPDIAPHPWDLKPKEAIALQQDLRQAVRIQALPEQVGLVAGTDLSYEIGGKDIWAAIVLLAFPSMEFVGYSGVKDQIRFPYVPGLLSFREIPALMLAWEQLNPKPDVMLTDGQGIAHPRRLGIAAHLGLLTGCPTIGCGKSRLTGTFTEPGPEKGEFSPLMDGEEEIGAVLRTKKSTKPIFVSPGHRADLVGSRALALACSTRYRLPEPTRQAHLTVNALRRGELTTGNVLQKH